MNKFSELLGINLYLLININGDYTHSPLLDPLRIEIKGGYQKVEVDGFEIKDWMGEVIDNDWIFTCDNFYQWKHQATNQGWLFYQNTK